MLWQTQLILDQPIRIDYLTGFVFSSTLFLYAIHRIVGIGRLSAFFEVDRYRVIATFKSHIFFYGLLAAVGALFCFYHLDRTLQWAMFIPGAFSLAYVVPFLGRQRRLRDINHIKIYLIAVVWAFVTVVLPSLALQQAFSLSISLMALERALFIFVITLPFDIRDLKVDAHSTVKTIPSILGVKKTLQLGYGLLVLFGGLVIINGALGFYRPMECLAMIAAGGITGWLLSGSRPGRHDYFFSGIMDGTMVFQFVLVFLGGMTEQLLK